MSSIADQLLKKGLVTREQVKKSKEEKRKKNEKEQKKKERKDAPLTAAGTVNEFRKATQTALERGTHTPRQIIAHAQRLKHEPNGRKLIALLHKLEVELLTVADSDRRRCIKNAIENWDFSQTE